MHHYRFKCPEGHQWLRRASVQRKNPRCNVCTRATVGPQERLGAAPGVVCVETEWFGPKHRYRLRCELGHEWLRRGDALSSNPECPECKHKRKHQAGSFAAMVATALAEGVICLDEQWHPSDVPYRFRCSAGHEFSKRIAEVRRSGRCPECWRGTQSERQFKHANLERLHARALARGGACLNTEYLGLQQQYEFRCAAGHHWRTLPSSIFSGSWCRMCSTAKLAETARLKDGLERLQAMAAARGGACLSSAYVHGKARYAFRCAKGHEWETLGANVLRGAWCHLCTFDAKRLSIDDARDAAHARGGECLSEAYVNVKQRLQWRCDRGHEWLASLQNVRKGHWCRCCASIARITRSDSPARKKYGDAGVRFVHS